MKKFAISLLAIFTAATQAYSHQIGQEEIEAPPSEASIYSEGKLFLDPNHSFIKFDEKHTSDDGCLEATSGGIWVNKTGKYRVIFSLAYQDIPTPKMNQGSDHTFALILNNETVLGSEITLFPSKIPEASATMYGIAFRYTDKEIEEGSFVQCAYTSGSGFVTGAAQEGPTISLALFEVD